ncbi:MAG: proline dehydrogenase family protein [Myxococcota bacterium]
MSAEGTVSFENTTIAFARKSNEDLRKARWLFRLMGNSAVVDIGSHLARMALRVGLPVTGLVKQTIYSQFCGGETLDESTPTIDDLAAYNVTTILDYGAEAKETEEDFDATVDEQLRAIRFADGNAAVPFISCKVTGYAAFELLEQLHRGDDLTNAQARAAERLRQRLDRICATAVDSDVAVYIDAEESWIQDGIDALVQDLMARYNQDKPVVFNTVQLYRHDRLAFLKRSFAHAREHGYILGVKLVRGAYMEKERDRAAQMGYPSPIHKDKASVDRDFDAALLFCLERIDRIAFCAATHNEDSCRILAEAVATQGIDPKHPHLQFAQLLGMSDHISFNLADAGYNAAKYVPYGPVREVVPYLIRRAEENRSVAGQMGRELSLIQQEIDRRRMARTQKK